MFLSVQQLDRDMGVDPRIGRFFVDRRIPENNRFWKKRLLYVSLGNGYVNIPVFYDLLFRIGVPLDSILNEKHVHFMESLMHFAMQQEHREISRKEELSAIRSMLRGRVTDEEKFHALNEYHDQAQLFPLNGFGTQKPSLNRADVYLYVLCDLPLTPAQWPRALVAWYALHPTYLIMDDIKDYHKDLEEGEENVVSDWGGGKAGLHRAFAEIEKNNQVLDKINPLLADYLREFEQTQAEIVDRF